MLGQVLGVLRTQYIGALALFIALGGTSYAAVKLDAGSVGSREIHDRSVKKVDIAAKAVGPRQLAPNAVTASKIANGSINSDDVQDGTLSRADFNAGQIPASAKGDRGPQGLKGDQGNPGAPGADGSPDTAQQVLDKAKTVDGAGSGLDADLLDGLSSTSFMKGNGTAASGNIVRLVNANDAVVLSLDEVTIRMDCALNTSVSLELVNSGGLSYTASMDDGSATQASTIVGSGAVMSSRQETQSRAAGRGLLVRWLVPGANGLSTITATAYFDTAGAPFCQAQAQIVRT